VTHCSGLPQRAADGASPRLIDVHHHVFPPDFVETLDGFNPQARTMFSAWPWTPQRSLALEGYPLNAPEDSDAGHFRGPRSMYDAHGFEPIEVRDRDTVVRLPVISARSSEEG
jgi:hypothetical protein